MTFVNAVEIHPSLFGGYAPVVLVLSNHFLGISLSGDDLSREKGV